MRFMPPTTSAPVPGRATPVAQRREAAFDPERVPKLEWHPQLKSVKFGNSAARLNGCARSLAEAAVRTSC